MINLGQFREELKDYCLTNDYKVYSLNSNKILKEFVSHGYAKVSLKDRAYFLHRIIAFVHCSGFKEGLTVNHKDGNKLNNYPSNLEWITVGDNIRHAFETGLHGVSDKRIYTNTTIMNVCRLLQDGLRPTDISNMTGVLRETITNIKFGSIYKDISCDFDFSKQKREQRSSVERVMKICTLIADGKRDYEIVKHLNVNRKTVSNIRHRKTFNSISCNYVW